MGQNILFQNDAGRDKNMKKGSTGPETILLLEILVNKFQKLIMKIEILE